MKYYLFDVLSRIKRYSKKLDAQAMLYDKNWIVFNDMGEKEVFIFRPNNELLISLNGKVRKGKWELLPTSSILIDLGEDSYLMNAAFVDNNFLALNLDGTENTAVMIESSLKDKYSLASISSINNYLEETYIPKPTIKTIDPEVIEDIPVYEWKESKNVLLFIYLIIFIIFISILIHHYSS